MAQGQNAQRKNKDWWGKRPYSGKSVSNKAGVMKFFKRQVHKVERQEGKLSVTNEE